MTEVRTNIIYLTTHCNLDCSYCYERDNRNAAGFKHKVVTTAEIDTFVDEVSTREANNSSCVVIFGGEPLLRPDLIKELINKFIEKKSSSGVHFDLITNGTLITQELAELLKFYQETLPTYNSSLQVEVSFDVTGQGLRLFPNGASSKEAVLEGLKKLRDNNVAITISYVVSSLNVNTVLQDLIYCILVLKATKLGLKWATSHLETCGVDTEAIKTHLRPRLEAIYARFQVPICEEVSGTCQRCNKVKAGNNYFIPQAGLQKSATYTEKSFDHFKDLT